jgi:hypothetical protein
MGKGGVPCQICVHPKRHAIEIGMVHHVSGRVLAKRFNCSHDAIQRHRRKHLSPQMKAAILTAQRPSAVDLESLQRSEGEGILAQLVVQRARLQQLSDMAMDLGDVRAAVAVENSTTANLTFVAKLLGQLVQHVEVTRTSVLVSPDWLRIRQSLITAVRPYPEASRAVGAVLCELETAVAKDITERKSALVIEAVAVQ